MVIDKILTVQTEYGIIESTEETQIVQLQCKMEDTPMAQYMPVLSDKQ